LAALAGAQTKNLHGVPLGEHVNGWRTAKAFFLDLRQTSQAGRANIAAMQRDWLSIAGYVSLIVSAVAIVAIFVSLV
jgi:hypothetical protein